MWVSRRSESERGWSELFYVRVYDDVGVLEFLESVRENETGRGVDERTGDVRSGAFGVFSRKDVLV